MEWYNFLLILISLKLYGLNTSYSHHFKSLLQIYLGLDFEAKIAEYANSVDLDEVVNNEPPHLDLQYLPSSL